MMASTTTEPLLGTLRRHRILNDEHFRLLSRDAELSPGDPEALALWLQQRGWVTTLQADRIRHDRVEDLVLGPYVILDLIGEGGMGRVYKARDVDAGRVVALKVIHHHQAANTSDALQRFLREGRATAMLAHPNVVQVYDAGQELDRYYIAMQFLEGMDLGQLVKRQGRLPVPQACDFIRQACLGLQHIHERGLIHRDVKPSNLFVAGGGWWVGGKDNHAPPAPHHPPPATIKILDLGLVRRSAASVNAELTAEDMTLGTPDYIAPEQARDSSRVDIRADLYSLGCTFYYLLTGQAPFPQGTAFEKLIMHTMDNPTPVEMLRPDLPRAVGVIVRKLMAKAPAERYQTPLEAVKAIDAVSALASPPQAHRAESTGAPRHIAAEAARGVDHSTTPLVPVASKRPTLPGSLHRTVLPARPAPRPAAEAAPAVQQATLIASLKGGGCVTSLAFSRDRNSLAAGEPDGKIRIWGFQGSKPRQTAVFETQLPYAGALAFDPAGQTLVAGSGDNDGRVEIWDVRGMTPMLRAALPAHAAAVTSVAFAPTGNAFASSGDDANLLVWDVGNHDPRRRTVLKGDAPGIATIAFAPDGRSLAAGQRNGHVRLWSPGRWSNNAVVLPGHTSGVTSLAYAPDGRSLVTGSQDQTVRVWDLSGKPRLRTSLTGQTSTIRLVSFADDGKAVSAVSAGWHISTWDATTGTMLHEWTIPRDLICSLAITWDGRYLAAGLTSGRINIFRLGQKRTH